MTPHETPRRRATDIDDCAGHCNSHEDHSNQLTAISASGRTFKWAMGGFSFLVCLVLAIVSWIFQDTIATVRSDLKEIKGFVSVAAVTDATNRVEMESIKRRLENLEERQGTRIGR